MYRQYITYIFLGLWMSLGGQLLAQQEMGIHLMPRTFQALWTNPAHYMPYRVNVAFPQPYVHAVHSGFKYRDLVQPVPGTDSVRLNVDNALQVMNDRNLISLNTTVEELSFSFRILKLQLMVGARARGRLSLGYPRDLLQLVWEGNGASIGDTMDLAPTFEGQAFQEIAIGAALPITKKWRVGLRAKYLAGLVDIQTAQAQLDFSTSNQYYQLALDADYEVQVGALDFGNITTLDSLSGLNPSVDPDAFARNNGLGIDLGVTYLPSERWKIQASLLDLGYIRWRVAARSYRVRGTLNFDGIDPSAFLSPDTVGFDPATYLDSLVQDVTISDTVLDYRTSLSPQFYLSTTYRFPFKLRLSVMGHGERVLDKWRTAWGVGVSKDLGGVLSVGGIYSIRNGIYNSLGANIILKLGPTVIYAASDNVLSFLLPESAQFSSLRVGVNLGIGRSKKIDKN
ncbi:MAG: DUF5723 family protein [Bacteroidota bacterium]